MAVSFVKTRFSEIAVRVRYADKQDPKLATEWIDVCVNYGDLRLPSGTAISDPEVHNLAGLQASALLHVRDVLNAEIQRLVEKAHRSAR